MFNLHSAVNTRGSQPHQGKTQLTADSQLVSILTDVTSRCRYAISPIRTIVCYHAELLCYCPILIADACRSPMFSRIQSACHVN
jgi:hypothetical protein